MLFWKWRWRRIGCFLLGHKIMTEEFKSQSFHFTLKWCEYCDYWEIEEEENGKTEEVQAR